MARARKTPRAAMSKGFASVGCAAQGLVYAHMSQEQVVQWIDSERDYWSRITSDLRVVGSGLGIEGVKIALQYEDKLQRLRTDVQKGDGKSFEIFLATAEQLESIIGQSPLGFELQTRLQRTPEEVGYLYVALSRHVLTEQWRYVHADARRYSVLFGALVAIDAGRQLQLAADTSQHALRIYHEATDFADKASLRVSQVEGELDALHKAQKVFQEEIKAELEGVRKIYQSEVQTEEAAVYWAERSKNAWSVARNAIILFSAMLLLPFVWAVCNFSYLKQELLDIVSSGGQGFSLAPVALITIPVLAYGWLLRHVSRLFVQNLAIADDASYRRTMAVTYLGLNKDPNSGITTQERAIILNALFRPAPPHTADDGPPTGLMDLIKK